MSSLKSFDILAFEKYELTTDEKKALVTSGALSHNAERELEKEREFRQQMLREQATKLEEERKSSKKKEFCDG